MFGLRMPELLIILAILVLLFGASRLPQLGAGIGESIRALKKGLQGDSKETAGAQTSSDSATSRS
jgi:sec-independent protein translocase protein TatA